jgi:outer membrane lipoprotein-sorting protein
MTTPAAFGIGSIVRRLPLPAAMLALCIGAAAPAEAQNRAVAVLNGAAERYEAVETLCADFHQVLEVPLLRTTRIGTGRVCQGRPNLFGMRFDDPEGDLIVVDGDFAWVYFPSSDDRTAIRTTADRAAGGQDFHREFLVDPEVRYEVSYAGAEEVEGHATHRIRMTPVLPSSYRSALVWIDQGEPVLRRVRLEEENGNIRTITLEDVGFGEAPGDGWFTFTPPDGVLVMQR